MGKSSISIRAMASIFHGYVSHNQRLHVPIPIPMGFTMTQLTQLRLHAMAKAPACDLEFGLRGLWEQETRSVEWGDIWDICEIYVRYIIYHISYTNGIIYIYTCMYIIII